MDDDDEDEDDEDFNANGDTNGEEVGEEYDEEFRCPERHDDGDEDDEEEMPATDGNGASGFMDSDLVEDVDSDTEEQVDGIGDDVSMKQLFAHTMRQQNQTQQLLLKLLQAQQQPAPRMPDPNQMPAYQMPRGGHPNAARNSRQSRPASLPLDGMSRLFGPGFRAPIVKAVAAAWFKAVGVTSTGPLPYGKAAPIAMTAGGLNAADANERSAFDFQYKPELARVGSKTKQLLTSIFVDQLLTIYQLPSIVDAGSANPPNLPAHKAPFHTLRTPIPGFAGDARYKRFASWLACFNEHNALLCFETPQSRKLLETDFFARAEAKGLLPPAAQKWNLGSLAFFIFFVDQRLKVKTGTGGRDVYGNLKDGADSIAEVESICEWLMDPIACPTTWHVLLTIRQQNPHYGVAPPAVA